jgi:hypothetical protein
MTTQEEKMLNLFEQVSTGLMATANVLKSFEQRLNRLEGRNESLLKPTEYYHKNDQFNYNPYNNVMKREKILECLLRFGASYGDLQTMTNYKENLKNKLDYLNYSGNFNYYEVKQFLDRKGFPVMNDDMIEAEKSVLILCEQRKQDYEDLKKMKEKDFEQLTKNGFITPDQKIEL